MFEKYKEFMYERKVRLAAEAAKRKHEALVLRRSIAYDKANREQLRLDAEWTAKHRVPYMVRAQFFNPDN